MTRLHYIARRLLDALYAACKIVFIAVFFAILACAFLGAFTMIDWG